MKSKEINSYNFFNNNIDYEKYVNVTGIKALKCECCAQKLV